MSLVVCKSTFFTKGHKVAGGSIMAADHPLVERFPEHFVPMDETQITEATALPPEQGRVRIPPAPADKAEAVNEALTRPNNGQSRAVWAAYAAELGLDVPDEMKRDEIIELCDNEGQVAY